MNPHITISGARRDSATGPGALAWQVWFTAKMVAQKPFRGFVLARMSEDQDDLHASSLHLQGCPPEWLDLDGLMDAVRCYIFNFVRAALRPLDGSRPDLLSVDTPLFEERIDGVWRVVKQ